MAEKTDTKTEPVVVPTLKFAVWKGEAPSVPGRRERQPNPYDDIVKKSYDDKMSFSSAVPTIEGTPVADVCKSIARQLHNAARFHKIGVDVRFVEEANKPLVVWFMAREKRERKTEDTQPSA